VGYLQVLRSAWGPDWGSTTPESADSGRLDRTRQPKRPASVRTRLRRPGVGVQRVADIGNSVVGGRAGHARREPYASAQHASGLGLVVLRQSERQPARAQRPRLARAAVLWHTAGEAAGARGAHRIADARSALRSVAGEGSGHRVQSDE
jgi:hypothetical protein